MNKKLNKKRLILHALFMALTYITVLYVIWEVFLLDIPDTIISTLIFLPISLAYAIDFGAGGHSFYFVLIIEVLFIASIIYALLFAIRSLKN